MVKMIMHRFFYFAITDTRYWSRTTKTVYFARVIPKLQLYILNVFGDGSVSLDNSAPDSDSLGGDQDNDLEEALRKYVASEGYHEISEEEFMRHVDDLFPRWRELKFNKKTKEMYLPD